MPHQEPGFLPSTQELLVHSGAHQMLLGNHLAKAIYSHGCPPSTGIRTHGIPGHGRIEIYQHKRKEKKQQLVCEMEALIYLFKSISRSLRGQSPALVSQPRRAFPKTSLGRCAERANARVLQGLRPAASTEGNRGVGCLLVPSRH